MAASTNKMLKLLKINQQLQKTAGCSVLASLNRASVCPACLRMTLPCSQCDTQKTSHRKHRTVQFESLTSFRTIQARYCSSQAKVEDGEELDVLYRKVVVEVKGHDPAVLKSYKHYVSQAARELEIKIAQIDTPKYHAFRQSVLSSVHIFKKHQTQYEQRTHFLIFEFPQLTGSTADTFLEYIQRNLPEGVAMKVTKHRLEQVPDHMQPPISAET